MHTIEKIINNFKPKSISCICGWVGMSVKLMKTIKQAIVDLTVITNRILKTGNNQSDTTM